MTARIVAGTANPELADAVAAAFGSRTAPCRVERFPDGELRPVVDGVRGTDVYVVQPTGPAVNEHVVELLLLLDACRRAGAARITAVVPYFGYARQDRRGRAGEAVGARVMADAVTGAGAARLVVVDPHTAALEAMSGVPVEMLTAVPVLADALTAAGIPPEAAIVAPDLGAVKLAEHYASLLRRPVAVVRKTRVTGTTVRAEDLIGDVAGRPALVVDDMISTGGTIEAAVRVLLAGGAVPEIIVAAVHGLLVGGAVDRLAAPSIRRVFVTDTLAARVRSALPLHVVPVSSLLADAIGRMHRDEALDELLLRS